MSGQQTVTVYRSTLDNLTQRALNLAIESESLATRLQTRNEEVTALQAEMQTLNDEAERLRIDIDYWKSQSAEALRESKELQAALRETERLQRASETALLDYTATFVTYRAEAAKQIARLQSSVRVWRVVGGISGVVAILSIIIAVAK